MGTKKFIVVTKGEFENECTESEIISDETQAIEYAKEIHSNHSEQVFVYELKLVGKTSGGKVTFKRE